MVKSKEPEIYFLGLIEVELLLELFHYLFISGSWFMTDKPNREVRLVSLSMLPKVFLYPDILWSMVQTEKGVFLHAVVGNVTHSSFLPSH